MRKTGGIDQEHDLRIAEFEGHRPSSLPQAGLLSTNAEVSSPVFLEVFLPWSTRLKSPLEKHLRKANAKIIGFDHRAGQKSTKIYFHDSQEGLKAMMRPFKLLTPKSLIYIPDGKLRRADEITFLLKNKLRMSFGSHFDISTPAFDPLLA